MSVQKLLRDTLESIFSFVFTVPIVKTTSKYTQAIQVVKNYGSNELIVNGICQSGPLMHKIWQKSFRFISSHYTHPVHSVLVMGLGGGSIGASVRSTYPHASIDFVELDDVIVSLWKTYFRTGDTQVRNLYCADAQSFRTSNRYDGVFIDIFNGNHVPDFVPASEFLGKIRTLLTSHGFCCINYFDDMGIGGQKKLEFEMKKLFPFVSTLPVRKNYILIGMQ